MTSAKPVLSIVIATYNGRENLGRCLDALLRQTADPSEFEVVVADDGSSDGGPEEIEALKSPFRLRVLRLQKGGQAAAQNAGVEQAEGAACLLLDDDVIAAPGLVAAHLRAHRDSPRTLAIGDLRQDADGALDWFARAFEEEWNAHFLELTQRPVRWTDCWGGNLSFPRDVFLEIGGVSTELKVGYDIELGYRLALAGCAIAYLADAASTHEDHKRRRALLERARGFGGFAAEFVQTHPEARPDMVPPFLSSRPLDAILRRILLALRVSPVAVVALADVVPGGRLRRMWYALTSRYAFWLGIKDSVNRAQWRSLVGGVPVLMYHAFGDDGRSERFMIDKASFKRQMRLLKALRYSVIPFEDLVQKLRAGETLPPRTVAITIDDGYLDNLRVAWPILKLHRYSATVFLVTRKLGGVNDWTEEGEIAKRPLLSADDVVMLQREGVRFGAHTRHHSHLPDLAEEALTTEIGASRQDLAALLEEPIETFAYPYGAYDDQIAAATAEAGFAGAATVKAQLARRGDHPMRIPRIEIEGGDSLLTFLRKLWLGGR